VNPTRSANSTEQTRRSATGAARVAAAADGDEATAPSAGAPQALQNRCPAARLAPHAAHDTDSGVPHPPQNRLPGGFCAPQAAHAMSTPGLCADKVVVAMLPGRG
jgi:hypothetical protein